MPMHGKHDKSMKTGALFPSICAVIKCYITVTDKQACHENRALFCDFAGLNFGNTFIYADFK